MAVTKMNKTALALAFSIILSGCNGSSSGNEENGTSSATTPTSTTTPTSPSGKLPSKITGSVRLLVNGYSVNGLITPDGYFVGNTSSEAVYVGQLNINGTELTASLDHYIAGSRGQYQESFTNLKGQLASDNTFVLTNDDGNSLSLATHYSSQYPQFLADMSETLDAMADDDQLTINSYAPRIIMRKDMSVYVTKESNFYWPNCEATGAYEPLAVKDQDYMLGSITFTGCTGPNMDEKNGIHKLFTFSDRDDDGVIYLNNFMIKDKVVAEMLD